MVVPNDALTQPRTQYPLARDFVDYAGQPVAFVVADDRYIAEDACDLIQVEYVSSRRLSILKRLIAAGADLFITTCPGNVAARLVPVCRDVEASLCRRRRMVEERLYIERGAGQPMECRAVTALYRTD